MSEGLNAQSSEPAVTGGARHRGRPKDQVSPGRLEGIAPVLARVIEILPVPAIKAYRRRLKRHTERDVHQIAMSIATFGFNNPIIVDADNVVAAGHGRLAAAMYMQMAEVPIVRVAHLTPERVQAYRIAENVLAARVGIDQDVLRVELRELVTQDLDFEIEAIGMEMAEIDLVLDGKEKASEADTDDEVPEASPVSVSQLGDHWLLGPHALFVGDARDPKSWNVLLAGRKAAAAITDAPYNVRVSSISGSGRTQHREFAFGSGEMTRAEYVAFLTAAHRQLADHCVDGALLYSYIDWKHQRELIEAGEACGLRYYNLLVWNKTNAGMGSMYRSKHELIVVFKKGEAPHQNNVQLGRFGRWRANVLDYPGANTFRRGRMEELSSHPTPKTVSMLADLIRDCTRRGDLVTDAFLGSGSTILAAERTGRVAAGTEIDPIYADVIVRRWQARTGKAAVHAMTGRSFDETADERAAEDATPARSASAA